ncbi:hypothetical protein IOCL2690_000647300 [Leishmania lindenbergi]|uniref:Uncharacterized protein n=1 Tax=Leishmania lindenbergi TaxID=651832 RepID=A0AAW3A3M3_9TRYP
MTGDTAAHSTTNQHPPSPPSAELSSPPAPATAEAPLGMAGSSAYVMWRSERCTATDVSGQVLNGIASDRVVHHEDAGVIHTTEEVLAQLGRLTRSSFSPGWALFGPRALLR